MVTHPTHQSSGDGVRPIRVLRRRAVEERLGISASTIYDKLDPKSPRYDATFPKQIRLGGQRLAVGWLESEVDAWSQQQVRRSRGEC